MSNQKTKTTSKIELQGTLEGAKDSINKATKKLDVKQVFSVLDAEEVYSKFSEETKLRLEQTYLSKVSLNSSQSTERKTGKELYKTEFVNLTPDMAIYILANRNKRNRSIGRDFVKKLYREMVSGRWVGANGQSISIDWNGDLVDGQHRLCAVYNSNLPFVEVNFVSGLDPESFTTIDQGKKRSFTDHLQYEYDIVSKLGMEKATGDRVKSVSSWMQSLSKSFSGYGTLVHPEQFRLEDKIHNNPQRDMASLVNRMILSKPKVVEIVRWYEEATMDLNKRFFLLNKNGQKTTLGRASSIPIALMEYALIDKNKAHHFLHRLYSPFATDKHGVDQPLPFDNPIQRFREKWMSGCSSMIGNASALTHCYHVLVRHCMAHYFGETTSRLLSPKQGGKVVKGFQKNWARLLTHKGLFWPQSWEESKNEL